MKTVGDKLEKFAVTGVRQDNQKMLSLTSQMKVLLASGK
jgi:hypothetical protein